MAAEWAELDLSDEESELTDMWLQSETGAVGEYHHVRCS